MWRPQQRKIEVKKLLESQLVAIEIPSEHWKDFKELVQRATDKWPDAPATIKHFADIVTNGKPMQDYFANPHLAGKVKPNPSDREYAIPSMPTKL